MLYIDGSNQEECSANYCQCFGGHGQVMSCPSGLVSISLSSSLSASSVSKSSLSTSSSASSTSRVQSVFTWFSQLHICSWLQWLSQVWDCNSSGCGDPEELGCWFSFQLNTTHILHNFPQSNKPRGFLQGFCIDFQWLHSVFCHIYVEGYLLDIMYFIGISLCTLTLNTIWPLKYKHRAQDSSFE